MSNSKANVIEELKEKSFTKYFSDPLLLKENVLFKTKLNIGYHGEFDPGSG
jgi:hypothetical protein